MEKKYEITPESARCLGTYDKVCGCDKCSVKELCLDVQSYRKEAGWVLVADPGFRLAKNICDEHNEHLAIEDAKFKKYDRLQDVENMIPTNDTWFDDLQAVVEKLENADGWTVGMDIRPYLGADVMYAVAKQDKGILVTVYSAGYPYSLYDWIDALTGEMNQIINMPVG